jgi:hypothetical protein
MNPIEFSQRLFQSEPDSPEAATLARDLVEDARFPAYLVLQRYLSIAGSPEQMKAKNVLADLRELALVPLAGSAPLPDLDSELWVMRTMVEEVVTFRQRAASVLKGLLSNRRPVPPVLEGSAYQPPPGARVCDMTYILLHRLLHVEMSPSDYLGMLRADRDKRITEFQNSRVFRSEFESQL